LTSKSLTTNDLVVNESLNIDNVITYEKYKQFDTLVMRRQNEDDTRVLNRNEIQVFVNNDNILVPNPTGMTSYFAKWSAKFTPIASVSGAGTELVYNNSILFGAESLSAGGANALIIKNITPTFVDEIQAIVFYNRGNGGLTSLSTGLIFELYNSVDDPDLLVPLAVTPIITTANYLHRFDFPAITTYTNGFNDNAYQSTTQIPDTTKTGLSLYAITTLNIFDAEVSIAGNVNVNGGVNIDTGEYFDTLVVRFPDLETTNNIQINELQVWVNGSNLLVENSASLTSYFAEWEVDKNASIEPFESNNASAVYNNVIESVKGAVSDFDAVANALIIKDIPSTLINNIQAIVHYNRDQFSYSQDKAIGLIYELYNETNDPNFTRPLATTNQITTSQGGYRFDFPSITDYTGFATGDSITNIIREEDAETETANYTLETFTIKGNATITGQISCNTPSTTGNATIGGSLFLGDTNLTEDIDGLLTLSTDKRLTINRLTSASVITGEVNCDYLNTTFEGKFENPNSNDELTLSGTQIQFNSDSFISNTAGGNSGNHLVIFVNGTEYKIKLENAS